MTPALAELSTSSMNGKSSAVDTAPHTGRPCVETSGGTPVRKKRALLILGEEYWDAIYPPALRSRMEAHVEFVAPPQSPASVLRNPHLLEDVELVFTGWETICFNAEVLQRAPRLEAVFHGAGSVKPFVSDAFWERGIVITSAASSNAIPVSEYTLGTILLSLKHFWRNAALAKQASGWGPPTRSMPGCYHSKVGLVSLGVIARRVIDLLSHFETDILVHCPFLHEEEAAQLGVTPVSLQALFRSCDVVSLHTPVLPETHGLITGQLIDSMKPGATLINTARGVIINQPEMIEVLRRRPDLTLVTDVIDPDEPPHPDNPLLGMPNVVVTPHIAGSQGLECSRMGAYMLEELERYLAGRPLRWAITKNRLAHMA